MKILTQPLHLIKTAAAALTLVAALCFVQSSYAAITLPYSTNFDSTAATQLGSLTGWGNAGNQVTIITGSITDSGYSSSTGKMVNEVGAANQGACNAAFTGVSGNLYMSFYLYVTSPGITDDTGVILGFDTGTGQVGSGSFPNAVYVTVKQITSGTSGTFQLGIKKGGSAAAPTYSATLNAGTAYKVFIKREVVASSNNDHYKLWVITAGSTAPSESSPNVDCTDAAVADPGTIQSLQVRSKSGQNAIYSDGYTIDTTWSGVGGGSASAAKMLTVLPNQSFTSGSDPTGTPAAQTAGSSFTADIYAVNADGHTVDTTYTGSHNITLTGPTAGTFTPATSTAVTFGNGHGTLSVTLNQAVGSVQLIDSDGSLPGLASSAVQVSVGSLSQLQVLLPGESAAPGTATGKTAAAPSAQTAGTAFNVTINAVDANFNVVSSYPSSQTITLTGPTTGTFSPTTGTATTFGSGSASFSVTLNKAAATTLTLTDGGAITGASSSITPAAGSVAKLQILMPGEVASAGTATGKTGTPSNESVGVSFNVTVNAVDANWNVVNTSTPQVNFTSSNTGTTQGSGLPANGSSTLALGTGNFAVTFASVSGGGGSTVTANDAASVLTLSQSAAAIVNFANLFRSANGSGGNWSSTSTWEESTDGGSSWSTPSAAPTSADVDFVTIRSGFPVTVDVASSAAGVTVASGATLTVSGGSLSVTHNSSKDVDVHGTLNLQLANALTFGSGGLMTLESDGILHHSVASLVISGGTLTFNGHYYEDSGNALLNIPTATWSAASICEITGYTTFTNPPQSTSLGQVFGNFYWNCPSMTANVTFGTAFTNVQGDFSYNGGSGTLNIRGTGKGTLTVGGNINVQAGTLACCTTNNGPVVWVTNNLNITSGATFALSSGTPSAAPNSTVNLLGNLSNAGTISATASTALQSIHFAKGSGTQIYTGSGIVSGPVSWTVDSGSTADLGTNVIAGTGTFTNSAGGGLKTANASGFAGNITLATVGLSTGGNYTYKATSGNQSGDTLLPTTVNSLTIANSGGGKVILNQNETATNLTVSSGANLDFNGKTITTPNAPSLVGALTMEVVNTAGTFTGSKLTQSAGKLTYAGTLTVTTTGDSLADGNSIPLFSSPAYAGGFTSVTPPSQSGLTANTSQLTGGTGGNISYSTGGTSQPTISSVHLDGSGNLIISGINGTASGTYSVLTSTNVAAPLSTWVTNMTGTFSGNSGFTNSVPISSSTRQSFFIIKQP